jgi:hypothetical protein
MTRGDRHIFWRGPDASKQVDGDFTVRLASVLRKAGIPIGQLGGV